MSTSLRTALYGDGTPAVPYYVLYYAISLAAMTLSADGNTLTADANGALTLDGTAAVLGDTLAYVPASATARAGIYEVTAIGGASAPFVLTRVAALKAGVLPGKMVCVKVILGTRYANTEWRMLGSTPGADITIGTTALVGSGVIDRCELASYTDSSGTPGSATANTGSGRAAFAIGLATCTITNNLVGLTSIIEVQLLGPADATLTAILFVTPGAGSFVVTGNGTATAATKFTWRVTNART